MDFYWSFGVLIITVESPQRPIRRETYLSLLFPQVVNEACWYKHGENGLLWVCVLASQIREIAMEYLSCKNMTFNYFLESIVDRKVNSYSKHDVTYSNKTVYNNEYNSLDFF